ncbi:MAG: hypothetical protein WBL19_01685 [Minisyncoccia bacterium]
MALAYSRLPDVDSVRPKTAADDGLFRELAEVLEKHNALDRFGINILHTHFPINEGEVLFETTNRKTREQIIRSVSADVVRGQNILETSWRLGRDGDVRMACHCLRTPDGTQHQGHYET